MFWVYIKNRSFNLLIRIIPLIIRSQNKNKDQRNASKHSEDVLLIEEEHPSIEAASPGEREPGERDNSSCKVNGNESLLRQQ